MFLNKLNLYYQTLKHVKPTQLYHQVYYRSKNRYTNKTFYGNPSKAGSLNLEKGISYPQSYSGNNTFTFLNLEKQFSKIDWNFSEYGKLWTYNLNYFEFLHQEEIKTEEGVSLIRDYVSSGNSLKDGLEPYPISLRGINWIKYLAENKIEDREIDTFLFSDYMRLVAILEYHLLANHLLENGFSLLFGAYYFQNEDLYKKAERILKSELKEQILVDGAHYELSPMYHQIILHRILDCYNLVVNNPWKNKELLPLLKEKAEIMLGWLDEISFRNGEIPKLNDTANGIAPTTYQLFSYAKNLDIQRKEVLLTTSGYRRFIYEGFEIIMDVGQIAPAYQPGHSHADSLQFVLNYNDKPVIVDTGISTYEKNERRQLERSTCSHNTVSINDKNSSNIWGGFRVAERAKVQILKDTAREIEALHDGYRRFGLDHKRKFSLLINAFNIEDEILSSLGKKYEAKGHLHFHPDTQFELKETSIIVNDLLTIEIAGAEHIELETYDYAAGFNKLQSAKKIVYQFTNKATLLFHANSATVIAAGAAESLRPPRETPT